MPTGLPLSTVVLEIVRHTPAYVWAILAALIVLGALQWRDHTLTRTRVLLAPAGLGAFSLWSTTVAFGANATVIVAWLVGTAVIAAANRRLRWPRVVRPVGNGAFAIRGSAWPLVLMLGMFALRYAVAVTLAFHRDWASHSAFALPLACAYGALSGLFAARALRILGTAPIDRSLVAA